MPSKSLEEALTYDLGDFFEFELARDRMTEINAEHPLERALGVPVIARVGGRIFAEFAIAWFCHVTMSSRSSGSNPTRP